MRMPNFLIIGAAKSGTGALHYYLKQHPQIYMSPVREPHFFALEGEPLNFQGPGDDETINQLAITAIADYLELYQDVSDEVAIGESSVSSLYKPEAAQRIHRHIPSVKLIVILRNPVERAYSSYLYMVARGREPCATFLEALQEEERRIKDNWQHIWHYQKMGFYYEQLKRYLDRFDAEQLKVYLYDDFVSNSQNVLKDVFRFLDVDDAFQPDTSLKPNVSGVPSHKALYALLMQPGPIRRLLKGLLPRKLRQDMANGFRKRTLHKSPLPPELRRQLTHIYRKDILCLQELIQRDLSGWLGEGEEARAS